MLSETCTVGLSRTVCIRGRVGRGLETTGGDGSRCGSIPPLPREVGTEPRGIEGTGPKLDSVGAVCTYSVCEPEETTCKTGTVVSVSKFFLFFSVGETGRMGVGGFGSLRRLTEENGVRLRGRTPVWGSSQWCLRTTLVSTHTFVVGSGVTL